jgi:hypothetical protein
MLFLKVVVGTEAGQHYLKQPSWQHSHLSLFVRRGEAGMSSLSKPFKYMREKQEIKGKLRE